MENQIGCAGHRSRQIRQPAPQSKLRELRQRARYACFVPMIRKIKNNRDLKISPLTSFGRNDKWSDRFSCHVERLFVIVMSSDRFLVISSDRRESRDLWLNPKFPVDLFQGLVG